MRTRAIALSALLTLSLVTFAQHVRAQDTTNPPVMNGAETATVSAKVVGIDYKTREITLQNSSGATQTYQASPEIKRFNDIKVGDTITFAYQQSVALNIVKAGAQPATAPSSSPIVTQLGGPKPGGQISQTQTTTVTIQAIDMTKPSITVKTEDGRVLSFAVKNKDLLTGFKVGDVVQVTYSEALMIAVK
jgi:Cu/Ag efflux protein CusF